MTRETITLTQKEQHRVHLLTQVQHGPLQAGAAAQLLGLSLRHLRRLLARLRQQGLAALAHGNRGRPSPRRLAEGVRTRVLTLARTTYAGVNDHHLTELLAEREGLQVSRRTVQRLLRAAGIGSPRTVKTHGAAFEGMIRWMGCARNEDRFRATPAGAVLISALFGWARGGLRLCNSCGGFTIFSRQGFQRKYCDKCRALSRGRADRATGLPRRRAELWRKASARMRRRGFDREGRNDPESRRLWKIRALHALHEADTPEQLGGWEEEFAPKAKAGRPRK